MNAYDHRLGEVDGGIFIAWLHEHSNYNNSLHLLGQYNEYMSEITFLKKEENEGAIFQTRV